MPIPSDALENITGVLASAGGNLGQRESALQKNPKLAPGLLESVERTWDAVARSWDAFQEDPAGSSLNDLESYSQTWRNFLDGLLVGNDHNVSPDISASDAWNSVVLQSQELGKALKDIVDAEGTLAKYGNFIAFLTSLEQIVSTLVAVIPFPALPGLRMLDLDLGVPHAHSHPPNLTPPNPVPVPLPSIGTLIPVPMISGASKTIINGMPAARCGDWGVAVWCGSYVPFFEVFLGSSSVWIEGGRAARMGIDVTKHCIFSSPKAPKTSDAPIGPPIGFTTNASPNVIIGGFPMPSLVNLAMAAAIKGLFKGLGKLTRRLRGMSGKGARRFSRATEMSRKAARESGEVTQVSRRVDGIDYRSNYIFASRKVEELERKGVIRIVGDEAFAEGVRRDLRRIACSDTGKRLISELEENHGKYGTSTEIRPLSSSEHSALGPHTTTSKSSRLSSEGKPSDSTVYYEPGKQASSRSKHSPSDTVLVNQLEHSRNAGRGELVDDVTYSDPNETQRWKSLENEEAVRREDAYRSERGLPLRNEYGAAP